MGPGLAVECQDSIVATDPQCAVGTGIEGERHASPEIVDHQPIGGSGDGGPSGAVEVKQAGVRDHVGPVGLEDVDTGEGGRLLPAPFLSFRRAAQRRQRQALAGLAAGAKYPGALALLPLAMLVVLREGPARAVRVVSAEQQALRDGLLLLCHIASFT